MQAKIWFDKKICLQKIKRCSWSEKVWE